MRFNEQGRSMIEMLGVLAIVGVLSVGGIAGYSKAMNKFKTNKVVDQISMLSTNIRTLFSSQGNYNGLNNTTAIKTGSVPSEMYNVNASNTSTISNAFGGDVKIYAADVNSITDGGFVIAIDNVPQASCVSIATSEWGSDAGSGLYGIGIPGVSTKTAADTFTIETSGKEEFAKVGDANYGLPYKVSAASIKCAGGKDKNVIFWVYY